MSHLLNEEEKIIGSLLGRPDRDDAFLRKLLADDNGDDTTPQTTFTQHVVLPEDTFNGICLRYKVSPLELRRINNFSGSNLRLAPAVLRVPVTDQGVQDTNADSYKIQALRNQFPTLEEAHARA